MKYRPNLALVCVGILGLLSFVIVPVANAQQDTQELRPTEVTQDGNRFNVMTAVSNGGSVTGIQVFPEYGSILISIETGSEDEDSQLRIVLPRDLIDSRDQDTDSKFDVIVEGKPTEYTEVRATDASRELEVPLPGGTSQVEIFGSHIVPEFPVAFLVGIVTFAIMIANITVLRMKLIRIH